MEPRMMDIKPPKAVVAARTIGAILVDSGKLSAADAEQVLRQQKENNLRFGDAALLLGLVSEQDIAQALAQQYNYAYLIKGEGKVAIEVIAAYEPFSPQVEALRALRSQLMLRCFAGESDHKTLALCSAERSEGRSYLAANLAVIFSQLGEHTLLIDADLRHPRQHELFKADDKAGLSSILAGRGGLEAIQPVAEFENLSLLTAGPVPPNPQELLGQATFVQLLETVSSRYDVVLIDTPAAKEYGDTQMIAARARAALLVARKHKSSLAATHKLSQSLGQVGINLVGTVLTEF
jgi:receptor protein-tyrosine kinase